MTFLPIVERELRVAARKPVTYRSRVVVATISLIFGVLTYFGTLGERSSSVGYALFIAVSGPAAIYCTLVGLPLTVDCLTDEKKEGTLGLLFLTDLKGWDIILGKLAASSFSAFYSLLALLPILAIPSLTGGLSGAQIFRMALVLIVVFLFSLAISIFASAGCRTHKTAASLAISLHFLFLFILPGIAAGLLIWTSRIPDLQQMPLPFLYTSPGFVFAFSLDNIYVRHAADFWCSLGLIHALTWLFIWGAAWVVPRSWQESAPAVPKSIVSSLLRRPVSPQELARRAAYRKRLLDINPFFWLAARNRFKPVGIWVFIGLMVFGYLLGALLVGREWFIPPSAIILALALNGGLKLMLASEAGLRIAEGKKSGAMELILSTPITVDDILRGQWLALRRQFLRPFVAVVVLELILVAVTRTQFEGEKFPALYPFMLCGLVMLGLDLLTLGWVAMYQAMFAPKPHDAGGLAVIYVLFVPWLVVIITLVGISAACEVWRVPEPGPYFSLALWFALGLFTDLFFGTRSRRRLLTRFRLLATTRYVPGRFRIA